MTCKTNERVTPDTVSIESLWEAETCGLPSCRSYVGPGAGTEWVPDQRAHPRPDQLSRRGIPALPLRSTALNTRQMRLVRRSMRWIRPAQEPAADPQISARNAGTCYQTPPTASEQSHPSADDRDLPGAGLHLARIASPPLDRPHHRSVDRRGNESHWFGTSILTHDPCAFRSWLGAPRSVTRWVLS